MPHEQPAEFPARPRLTLAQKALATSTEAQQMLDRVARNFVVSFSGADYDDVRSAASMALLRAAQTYVPGKVPFVQFARLHVRGHVLRTMARDWAALPSAEVLLKKAESNPSRLQPADAMEAARATPQAAARRLHHWGAEWVMEHALVCAATPERALMEAEAQTQVGEALSASIAELGPTQRDVVRRSMAGEAFVSIARSMGFSSRTLQRRHGEAMASLKRGLASRGVHQVPCELSG